MKERRNNKKWKNREGKLNNRKFEKNKKLKNLKDN